MSTKSTSSKTSLDSENRAMQPLALPSAGKGMSQGPLARLHQVLFTEVESFLTLAELLQARCVCHMMNNALYNTPIYKRTLEISRLTRGQYRTVTIDNISRGSQPVYDLKHGLVVTGFIATVDDPSAEGKIKVLQITSEGGQKVAEIGSESFQVAVEPDPDYYMTWRSVAVDGEKEIFCTARSAGRKNGQSFGTLEFWEAGTGKLKSFVPPQEGGPDSVFGNRCTQLFARKLSDSNHQIEFYNLKTANEEKPIPEFSSVIDLVDTDCPTPAHSTPQLHSVTHFDFSRKIAVCSRHSNYRIWDFTAQKYLWGFEQSFGLPHYNEKEGTILVSATHLCKIEQRDIATGKVIREYASVTDESGETPRLETWHIDSVSRRIFARTELQYFTVEGHTTKQGIVCWHMDSGKVLTSFLTPSLYSSFGYNKMDYEPLTQSIFALGYQGLHIYSFKGSLKRAIDFPLPLAYMPDEEVQVRALCSNFILDKDKQRIIADVGYSYKEEDDYSSDLCRLLQVLDYSAQATQASSSSSQQGSEPAAKRARHNPPESSERKEQKRESKTN